MIFDECEPRLLCSPQVCLWGGRIERGVWKWCHFTAVIDYESGESEIVSGTARQWGRGVSLQIYGKLYRKEGAVYEASRWLPHQVRERLNETVFQQMRGGEGVRQWR